MSEGREDSRKNAGAVSLESGAQVRAVSLAERIMGVGELDGALRIGRSPYIGRLEAGGYLVVFRYGAVVFFGVPAAEQRRVEVSLVERARDAYASPEVEIAELSVEADRRPRSVDGAIRVSGVDVETLQVVAEGLARTVALAHREEEVATALRQMEPDIDALATRGRAAPVSQMVRRVGEAARAQLRLVGRVEVTEAPDAIWDRPELERLYHHIADDYELVERAAILDRKVALLSQTAGTLVELQQTRRSLRVEWYIVALIVVEICLTLYEMFVRH